VRARPRYTVIPVRVGDGKGWEVDAWEVLRDGARFGECSAGGLMMTKKREALDTARHLAWRDKRDADMRTAAHALAEVSRDLIAETGAHFWGDAGGEGLNRATCDVPLDAVRALDKAIYACDVASVGREAAERRRSGRRKLAVQASKRIDAEQKKLERREREQMRKWKHKHPDEAKVRTAIRALVDHLYALRDPDVAAVLLAYVRRSIKLLRVATIKRSGKWYAASAPVGRDGAHTQGRTRREAVYMLLSAADDLRASRRRRR
jgi:hypothetical protein